MTAADYSSPRRIRLGAGLAAAVLHGVLALLLVRAFAPDFAGHIADRMADALTVTVTAPPPKPPAPPSPEPKLRAERTPQAAGPAGSAGRRAEAQAISAPSPAIVLATQAAAPTVGQGTALISGARDLGAGTGAGGQGSGAGLAGNGAGGGGGSARAVKIAGDINSARDYPAATRAQRLGDAVIVALTVGPDGRVRACRVHRASRDPAADQITCRLAMARFRFRPATDAAGTPVASTFGWQQRWFDPKQKD